MKIFSYFALTLILCTILPVSAMAEEVIGETPEETTPEEQVEIVTEETEQGVTVNVNLPGTTDPVDSSSDSGEELEQTVASTYSVAALNETEPETASDPEQQTMKDVIVMVLGDYSPRTQTVTQYLSDGSSETYTEIVPGVAGMDWEWISGAGLFGLVLFSFLKLVGVLLKNG